MPIRTIIGGKKYQIFVVSVTASLLIINETVHYCGPFNKSSYLDVLIVKDVRLSSIKSNGLLCGHLSIFT